MKNKNTIIHTIVARAVIIQRGKILLSKAVGKKWYFLPGGHVEVGEFVVDALDRELREEIGTGIKKADFIGAHDNRYLDSYTGPNQELGLLFAVSLRGKPSDRESHIATKWVSMKKIQDISLMPHGVGMHIAKWHKNKKPLWMVKGQ